MVREVERLISKSALDIDDSFLVQELGSEGAGTVINDASDDTSDGDI